MADRTIKIILDASVTGLVNGFKTAGTAATDFGNRLSDGISRNEQHINTLSNTLGGIGLAATAGAGLAVKTFMDFDAAMSNVAATGEDARGSISALREAAIQAGADTSFSATEAAGAIEELAKAGLSAADILGGGLDGALDLAAAGGLSVADAAQYASTAMAQFGMSGRDVTHIADLLAAGAGKANGEVSDMGAALNQAGLVASQTGLSIEETTGSLAAFAQAGLLGSDAGTSLKTMLQRLSAPSGEAAALMEELKISAYDAGGNFVGMAEFAGQLTRAMGDMTPATRQATMATIFGADAVRAAGVIYQNGESGIRDWITAVDDQGYAAETAATKLDNLKGDLEGLGGSLETAFINGGSAANDLLRGIVQGADAAVDAIGGLPAPILNATTMLVGGGGLVALGVAGVGKLTIGLNNARIAANALGVSTKAAGLAAGGVGIAITAATAGLTAWAMKAAEARASTNAFKDTLDEFGNSTDETAKMINGRLVEAQMNFLTGGQKISEFAKEQGVSMSDLRESVLGNEEAYGRVSAAMEEYVAQGNLLEKASGSRGERANQLLGYLEDTREELSRGSEETRINAEANAAAGIASSGFGSAVVETSYAMASQTITLEDAIGSLQTYVNQALSARDASRGWEQAIDDAEAALRENGATLDTTTEKGRANQAALDNIAVANGRVVDAMQKNGATQDQVQGQVQRSRDEFLRMAEAMGMSAGDADNLANELGLIPGDYKANIIVQSADALRQIDAVRGAMAFLQDKTIDITVRQHAYNNAATAAQVVPGRASGGPVTRGSLYMVGEEGPELFIPKQSGTIINAGDTAAAMRSHPSAYFAPAYYSSVTSGPSTVNNFNSNVAADGLVADRIARNIAERTVTKQRDMMALYGIGSQ